MSHFCLFCPDCPILRVCCPIFQKIITNNVSYFKKHQKARKALIHKGLHIYIYLSIDNSNSNNTNDFDKNGTNGTVKKWNIHLRARERRIINLTSKYERNTKIGKTHNAYIHKYICMFETLSQAGFLSQNAASPRVSTVYRLQKLDRGVFLRCPVCPVFA